eukprot:evm.model.NODE_27169_length_92994_cov_27.080458.24
MSQASFTTGLPMPKNYDSVHASILGNGLYTQEKVKPLEEYLLQQVAEGSYDVEANKTLLKLYLLYPSLANQEKVETETVLTIKDAAEALETARYANFWSIVNSRGPVFAAIPTWKDDIRKTTYQSVDKAHIGDGVGLSGAALETFLKAQANGGVVASVEEDRVVFAVNKENQPRVRKFKETVDLQNMLGILNRLAA